VDVGEAVVVVLVVVVVALVVAVALVVVVVLFFLLLLALWHTSLCRQIIPLDTYLAVVVVPVDVPQLLPL
jgi:hypothetical protein